MVMGAEQVTAFEATRVVNTGGDAKRCAGPDAARSADVVSSLAELLMAPMSQGLWQCTDRVLEDFTSELLDWRRCIDVAEVRVLAEQVRRRTEATGMAERAAINRVGDVLALRNGLSSGLARSRVGFAVGLDARPDTLAGFAAGEVTREQAGKILRLIDTLPDSPGREQTATMCERALVQAARISTGVGSAFGRALSTLQSALDPDGNAPAEDPRRNELTLSPLLDGRYTLRGNLDAASAEALYTAILPMSAPRPEDDGTRDRRSAPRRRADALNEMVRRFLAGLGPDVAEAVGYDGGGDGAAHSDVTAGGAASRGVGGPEALPGGHARPQVHVHIRASDLTNVPGGRHEFMRLLRQGRISEMFSLLGAGRADYSGPLSSRSIRLLGCDAAVTPVIVDENGVPLSLGRTVRLASRAQRRALAVRDQGCAFPACTRPTAWTEAHHIVEWADGGPTDLDNLVSLCAAHHRAVHNDGWGVAMSERRLPVFRPPETVDPLRRWVDSHGLATAGPEPGDSGGLPPPA